MNATVNAGITFHTLIIRTIAVIVVLLQSSALSMGSANNGTDSTLRSILAIEDHTIRMQQLYDACTQTNAYAPRNARVFATAFYKENLLHPNDSNTAKSNYLLGDVALMSGSYDEALKHCLAGLNLAEKQKMYALQIELLSDISGVYLRNDLYDKSLATSMQALNIAQEQHYPVQEARMMETVGIRHAQARRYAKAHLMFDSAILRARQLRLPKLEEGILESKALTFSNAGTLDSSLAYMLKALPIADSLGIKSVRFSLLFQLGNLYFDLKRFDKSEQVASQAMDLSDEVEDPLFLIGLYSLYSRLNMQKGNYKLAYEYLRKEKTLQDSVFSADKISQIEGLRVRYDTEVKDKQIATQSAQLNLNKKINLFLWTSSVLLFIIGLLIYLNQRRTKELNIEISRQSEELKIKSQELEKLNQLKDRLFGVISHDLRTPVNSLISFTVLLDNVALPPEKLTLYSRELKNILTHTRELMENLLHFARSQMQAYNPMFEVVSIRHLVEEAMQLMQPAISRKQITVVNDADAYAMAIVDADMAALIFRNLLSNAVKYSFEAGKITIATLREGDKLLCTIKDEGMGMSPEMVAAFNNNDNQQVLKSATGTQHEKGTGLGLMLCRTFITLMHGSIQVTSEEGNGTLFTVTLPNATNQIT